MVTTTQTKVKIGTVERIGGRTETTIESEKRYITFSDARDCIEIHENDWSGKRSRIENINIPVEAFPALKALIAKMEAKTYNVRTVTCEHCGTITEVPKLYLYEVLATTKKVNTILVTKYRCPYCEKESKGEA